METPLDDLAMKIVFCEECPRLRRYRMDVARKKVSRFKNHRYWGRPVPGFGDPEAELLIVGLAPSAHGGNRTGRMFTGDASGDWLIRALFEAGFANQPSSIDRDDGLQLKSAYITAVVKCAPPRNKPTSEEIRNCSGYLSEELRLLRSVKVILVLGRVAFDAYLRHLPKGSVKGGFEHSKVYGVTGSSLKLVASYHPSRQNTQTGRLTWEKWSAVFSQIRRLILGDQVGQN